MSSTMEQVTLTTPDMSCGHCEMAIKESVGALDGVTRVEPTAATKQVVIGFDPNRVSLDKIEATLDDAGYPVQK